MKKIIFSVAILLLVAACGGSKAQKAELDVAAELANYSGACADVAFRDARMKLDEVDALVKKGKTREANNARAASVELYNAGVLVYHDLIASNARLSTDLHAQRLLVKELLGSDVAKNLSKADAAEARRLSERINTLHSEAELLIDDCNVPGSTVALVGSLEYIRALEDLLLSATPVVVAPVVTTTTYVVKKGDSLWKISDSKLRNPYFWPLIYWTNKSTIKDPDLIYPNQKLEIESNYPSDEKAKAEHFAKTRGRWSLYDNK